MNHPTFKSKVAAIENLRFQGETGDVIDFARKRSEFEERKLRQLIQLADQCDLKTAKLMQAAWQRMLKKSEATSARFKEMQKSRNGLKLSKSSQS